MNNKENEAHFAVLKVCCSLMDSKVPVQYIIGALELAKLSVFKIIADETADEIKNQLKESNEQVNQGSRN